MTLLGSSGFVLLKGEEGFQRRCFYPTFNDTNGFYSSCKLSKERPPHIIDVDNSLDNDYGHGCGDYYLLKNVADYYNGTQQESINSIDKSMQSHLMGFKAEESRLKGGEIIKF